MISVVQSFYYAITGMKKYKVLKKAERGKIMKNNTTNTTNTTNTVTSKDYQNMILTMYNFAESFSKIPELKPVLKKSEKCYRAFCLWTENKAKGNQNKTSRYMNELTKNFGEMQELAGFKANKQDFYTFLTLFATRYSKTRGKEEYQNKVVAMLYFKKSLMQWHKDLLTGKSAKVKVYKETTKKGKTTKK